jgi:hypothetical protein
MGNEVKTSVARDTYSPLEELARHAPRKRLAPYELRGVCVEAGRRSGRKMRAN